MKKIYLLLVSIGFTIPLICQNLAEWPLNDVNLTAPINVATEINAGAFTRGNGISSLQHFSSGTKAVNWPTSVAKEIVDYYEICLTIDVGQTASITGIAFQERRSSEGIQRFNLVYSKDNFATGNHILDVVLPDNTSWRDYDEAIDIKIHNGEQLCFRWYGFDAENNDGDWEIRANSLVLEGEILPSCTAPSIPTDIQIGAINATNLSATVRAGDGNARIVYIRKGAPVDVTPYQGDSYNGSPVFGSGDLVGPDTYVVGITAAEQTTYMISNLTEGATYFIAAYEYNFSGLCYTTQTANTSAATLCTTPSSVNNLLCSAIDGSAHLLWNAPNCSEQVLVVASESPISGSPTGDGSQYDIDNNFGSSATHTDFGASVFPVYLGTNNALTIAGLTNNTGYYINIYTLYGGSWSSPNSVYDTPEAGCAELNGEILYFNEIHYRNAGEEQDVGVEIAGRAGIDLSIYELYVYKKTGNGPTESVVISTKKLAGIINDEGDNTGTIWVPYPELPSVHGSIALYNTVSQEVVQYIAYRNAATAIDGPAIGMFTLPIKKPNNHVLTEGATQAVGLSIYRMGDGQCPSDFEWVVGPASPGNINPDQSLILPVDLLSFDAYKYEKKVLLTWETAIEINSDYFEIERSSDGRIFESIGQINAAGYSQEKQSYELWDYHPKEGINYYRLIQTDFDGTIYHHGVVSVLMKESIDRTVIKVFPNPVIHLTTLSWEIAAQEVKIVDFSGRMVYQTLLSGEAGSKSLNLSHLPKGMYNVQLFDGNEYHHTQLVRQ